MQISQWSIATAPESELREWYDLFVAGYRTDHPGEPYPPLQTAVGWFTGEPPFVVNDFWLARDGGGRVIGGSRLTRRTIGSNQHRGEVDVLVQEHARRRGVGTALLDAAARAAADARATVIGFEVGDTEEARGFLGRHGARSAIANTRSVLDMFSVDRADVAARAQRPAAASAYSLVSWDGMIPDDSIEAFASVSTVMNSAPRGDMSLNDEQPDVTLHRRWCAAILGRGDEMFTICTRHDVSGELVGLTQLVVLANGWPQCAWQEATGVDPQHRGHGLGLWMKASMLQRLLANRPALQRIETWNAAGNEHMLAINRRLGFRAIDTQIDYEIDTAAALEQLEQLAG